MGVHAHRICKQIECARTFLYASLCCKHALGLLVVACVFTITSNLAPHHHNCKVDQARCECFIHHRIARVIHYPPLAQGSQQPGAQGRGTYQQILSSAALLVMLTVPISCCAYELVCSRHSIAVAPMQLCMFGCAGGTASGLCMASQWCLNKCACRISRFHECIGPCCTHWCLSVCPCC